MYKELCKVLVTQELGPPHEVQSGREMRQWTIVDSDCDECCTQIVLGTMRTTEASGQCEHG